MPIDLPCNWDELFETVRRLAFEYVADMGRIVPSDVKRSIAIIAPTQPKFEPADVNALPGTELIIADGIKADTLTAKSVDVAAQVMRNANILLHDRKTGQLRSLRKVGQSTRLEFR
jgi:hypothetical protein